MNHEIDALVRQMREALITGSAVLCGHQKPTDPAMLSAIASADEWLSRQRGPLTDEEISRMWMAGYSDGSGKSMVNLFARAVERAHGIGQPAGDDKQ